jgi:hypothetical protein
MTLTTTGAEGTMSKTEAATTSPIPVPDERAAEQPEEARDHSPDAGLGPSSSEEPVPSTSPLSRSNLLPPVSTKRRSSWRHLLSPSYKSRCEEFHKLFADELPKGERLIADYSCALHREILLQGRLYVSINYLAFYSNIFSWITKLVVRLSDIRDIYKANTAKIIPNAIQIITDQGEKHVFASFIARDKTYLMIWQIWRNSNLIKERLSDQEIRRLVHLSYGKDLGLNDQEEENISGEPMARSSPSSSHEHDDNNNNNKNHGDKTEYQHRQTKKPAKLRFKSRSQSQKEVLSLIEEGQSGGYGAKGKLAKGHMRNSSVDLGGALTATSSSTQTKSSVNRSPTGSKTKALRGKHADRMVRHLSMRLANLSSLSFHDDDDDGEVENAGGAYERERVNGRSKQEAKAAEIGATDDAKAAHQNAQSPVSVENSPRLHNVTGSSSTSSAVVVDTPILMSATANRYRSSEPDVGRAYDFGSAPERQTGELEGVHLKQQTSNDDDNGTVANKQLAEEEPTKPDTGVGLAQDNEKATGHDATRPVEDDGKSGLGAEPQRQPAGECGCGEHQGLLIADEQFDIGVDILFSLIFTNSKFMRAHMIRRGMTSASVSKWRRGGGLGGGGISNNHKRGDGSADAPTSSGAGGGGDRSSSSTLSRDSHSSQHHCQSSLDSLQALNYQVGKVRSKQERQLSYSMNVNHVLAKQVQVEERQNICEAKPGLVYVLKSQTINSGFPCSESFTVDLTYCLTRGSSPDQSRMLVHGLVNFIKEKHSWRLSMIKSLLEKSSMQGIHDFISDLIDAIRDYVLKKKDGPGVESSRVARDRSAAESNQGKGDDDDQDPDGASTPTGRSPKARAAGASGGQTLARVKSKLKERKLRNMYKYYIHAAQLGHEHDASNDDGPRADRRPRPVNGDQAHARDDHSEPDETGGGHSSRANSDNSCSSMMSSVASSVCDIHDDDDSMVMMMAETNDDDDDGGHDYARADYRRVQHSVEGELRVPSGQSRAFGAACSTPIWTAANHANASGKVSFGRSSFKVGLLPLAIIGLLLVLSAFTIAFNVVLLLRVGRLEAALESVLAVCENGTPARLLARAPTGNTAAP